jgi:TPR repeat protein
MDFDFFFKNVLVRSHPMIQRYSSFTALSLAIALIANVVLLSSASASIIAEAFDAYDQGDYATAFMIFKELAEKGDAEGQNQLGYLYAQGYGVEQDYVRAHMWFNISAAMGNVLAATNRDSLWSRMTPEQVRQAEKLATSCVKKRFKGC